MFSIFASFPYASAKAQNSLSLELNSGIITPFSSNPGFTGSLKLNYHFTSVISLYVSTGYSGWDRNKVTFWGWGKTNPTPGGIGYRSFNSYSEDGHMLIPVYIGSTFNIFKTVKNLTAFLNAELGYSYLSYNSYSQLKVVDQETGLTETFYPDKSSKKAVRENLFGAGLGAGISMPIYGKVNLLLEYKLNSFVNKHYNGMFKIQNTYSSFTAGLNYSL